MIEPYGYGTQWVTSCLRSADIGKITLEVVDGLLEGVPGDGGGEDGRPGQHQEAEPRLDLGAVRPAVKTW